MTRFSLGHEHGDRLVDVLGFTNIRNVSFTFPMDDVVTAHVEVLLTEEQVAKLLGIARDTAAVKDWTTQP